MLALPCHRNNLIFSCFFSLMFSFFIYDVVISFVTHLILKKKKILLDECIMGNNKNYTKNESYFG